MLPFLEKLEEKVEHFDFRGDDVTFISINVHKYDCSTKATPVFLFRNSEFKKYFLYINTISRVNIFVNPQYFPLHLLNQRECICNY